MAKINWKPGTMIYPLPAVMVTCGSTLETQNIITIAWTGTICSDPPMCYISVRKNRHSHAILMREKEFVINLTTEELAHATDWCGVRSGEKYDKFKEMGLTAGKATIVKAPIIEESPLSIECKVTEVKELGSHDMFIAEVVNVLADEKYMDEKGAFKLQDTGLMAYSHGHYYKMGEGIGHFGHSVKKKK
jgi:flavin reductase (DIM6/NTAB) family NADH-FMN oxidoreductase RutF